MPRILVLALLIAAVLAIPAPASAAPRCFPEAAPAISSCIDGGIRSFWEAQGGLPVFGYPLGPASQGPVVSQVFERARLELHPENAPPYDVLLGRLGADALAARGEPPTTAEAPQPGCRFFEQTKLNVCGAFLAAYGRYGLNLGQPGVSPAESLALFGLPLTAPRQERLSDGNSYTVQWFERARFEDHGAQGVLFGLLGTESGVGGQESGVGGQESGVGGAPAGPALQPGGFILAQGDQLTRLGQPVTIKGVNYYPQGRPWEEMWRSWDAPQMARELRLGRDQLGLNAVRILLPYGLSSNADGDGVASGAVITHLRELAQIAGDLDMRLIVSLFDFYETFPVPGTRAEQANIAYINTLLGNFIGDDRIIAWDIHNEPDHYTLWDKEGNRDQVLSWLGRMADAIHAVAPNQLVTVGMGQYNNLWVVGPDGRRPVDYSDVISVHIYNAADAARQLDELRSHTGKPILLGEFGWPTGPACAVRAYSEQEQDTMYQTTLAAAQGRVAGVIAWTLRDFDAGPTMRWETREEHYGLFRPDGSLKPAAQRLRAYAAPPLPSQWKTDLPLSGGPPGPPGGPRAPLLIAESGHYVKLESRMLWDALGGRFNLGLPISEVFERADDQRLVQYFEGALVELYPEARKSPDFAALPPDQQMQRLVRFVDIGSSFTAGRSFPAQQGVSHDRGYFFPETGYAVDPLFRHYYDVLGGRWRLGAAISGKIEENVNGTVMPAQYFQNGRLERSPLTQGIEVGRLGSWAWGIQCSYVR
ncbi:cellulase family glycosylhydrolase [Chloroflexales bacterium ZM16-3]|nr:cellulase family glycosylhydrolase [Chloroflexales bacterium ZM16-3]